MRKIIPLLFIVLAVFIFVGCAGYRQIDIDTLELGEAYLPSDIKQVLVLNNTLPQMSGLFDGEKGCEYLINGVQFPCSIPHTGLAQLTATKSLAESLADTRYFREVLVRDTTFKTEGFILDMRPLTPQTIDTICRANDVDAVISVDRLLFNTNRNISTIADNGYFFGTVRIDVHGVIRAYLPRMQEPYRTVFLRDTVFFTEDGASIEEIKNYLPSDSACIIEASSYVFDNLYKAFVPYRQIGQRIYYLGSRKLWKEGASFAAANKWDLAEKCWQELYAKSKKVARGKAAFNVALARELQDDFQGAIQWGNRSKDQFRKLNEKEYLEVVQLYLKLLQERLENNRRLEEVVGF